MTRDPDRRLPIRHVLLGLPLSLVLVAVPGLSFAQASAAPRGSPVLEWSLADLQSGLCVQLLVDSTRAAAWMPYGLVPARADAVSDLAPVLARVVATEPQYAAWSPSDLCVFFYRSVSIGGRTYQNDGEPGKLVGLWTIAARRGQGGNEAVQAAVLLLTDEWKLVRAAEPALVPVKKVAAHWLTMLPDTGARQTIQIDKTILTWNLRPARDTMSAPAPPSVQRTFLLEGQRRILFTVEGAYAAAEQRRIAGDLSIGGKSDLGRIFAASPIRFVGPLLSGGSGSLLFYR